eukprot:GHUV01058090.1.p4 GENE.GHUV01058090.1~~GHUV01058090.1.p4  ORF type:complete len:103 (-),score=19.82 GHUV01058090.1:80-388(-)
MRRWGPTAASVLIDEHSVCTVLWVCLPHHLLLPSDGFSKKNISIMPRLPCSWLLTADELITCTCACVLQADALVGVCRDLDQNCSQTITFDLSRFEPPTEAA